MQHRACIISRDLDFAQFVRLTLLTRLRAVSVTDGEDIPAADIYVIDLDTIPSPPAVTGRVLWCSSELDKPADCPCLWADRPFRPARLLALLDLAEEEKSALIHPYTDRPAVLIGDNEVALSAKEHALLLALWEANGDYRTREELLSTVWHGENPDPGVVNVYIHYLRRKLERDGQRCIFAARGRGYRLTRGELAC